MKKFLWKAAVLISVITILVGYCEYRARQIPTSYGIKKGIIERRVESAQVLVLGSSHAEVGLVPRFFKCDAVNLANSSQSLYYDIRLIDQYLDRLKNLKVALLSIDLFSFELRLSDSPESWRTFFYYQYFKIDHDNPKFSLDLRNHSALALFKPIKVLSQILRPGLVQDWLGGTIDSDGALVRRFYSAPTSAMSPESGRRQALYNLEIMKQENANKIMQELQALVIKLQQRDVSVVLLTLPTFHTYWQNVVDTKEYERMQSNIKQIVQLRGVVYFNYLADERFSKEDFYDDSHLNIIGAEKMARIVQDDFLSQFCP